VVLILVLLALAVLWFSGRLGLGRSGISASVLTPAPTPADDRNIAVLTLVIRSDGAGNVVEVVLRDGSVVPGYGPNVLNRPGAWTVSLASGAGEALRYGAPDPRQVRVEGGSDDAPHTSAFEPEVEVVMVIPLHDAEGRDLAVTGLRLYDQSGNLIFAAGLRGSNIVPFDIRQLQAGAAG
jgi:hypothetical protein